MPASGRPRRDLGHGQRRSQANARDVPGCLRRGTSARTRHQSVVVCVAPDTFRRGQPHPGQVGATGDGAYYRRHSPAAHTALRHTPRNFARCDARCGHLMRTYMLKTDTFKTVVLLLTVLSLAGCDSIPFIDNTSDYKGASRGKPLEVPPALPSLSTDDASSVPGSGPPYSASH